MSDPAAQLAPIRTETLDRAVTAALARFISNSGLTPGARLPTERDLAERLSVSRSTVREALKRWEGLGVVEMRKGSGVYLKTPIAPDSVHLPLTVRSHDVASLLHTLEVRRALEGEAAAICALRASPAEIAGICEKLDRMEAAFLKRNGFCPEEDWDFHLAVINAAGNPLFEQIVSGLYDLLHRFWERPLGISDFGQASFPFHRTMCEAIARRDPEAARAEALKLLSCTEADLRRGAARADGDAPDE